MIPPEGRFSASRRTVCVAGMYFYYNTSYTYGIMDPTEKVDLTMHDREASIAEASDRQHEVNNSRELGRLGLMKAGSLEMVNTEKLLQLLRNLQASGIDLNLYL